MTLGDRLMQRAIIEPWQWVMSHKFLALVIAAAGFVVGAAVLAWILALLPPKIASWLSDKLWVLAVLTLWVPPLSLFITVAILAVRYNVSSRS